MAVIRPAGSATSIAIPEASSVPETSGRTPKCLSEKSGVHTVPNRNSSSGTSRRNAAVSNSSTAMIPAVTRIDPAALRNSARSMRNSPIRLARVRSDHRARRCSSVSWLWLSVPSNIDPVLRAVNRSRTFAYSCSLSGT